MNDMERAEIRGGVGRERALEILGAFRAAKRDNAVKGFRVGYDLKIPASEQGLADLGILREEVLRANSTPLEHMGQDKAELVSALKAGGVSVDALGWNRERGGFVFRLSGPYGVAGSLPKGEALPDPLLGKPLVGTMVEDPGDLMSTIGACEEGSLAFLDRFGIDFETESEGGCCCGEDCHSDEERSLSWIDSFELTQEMVDYIDGEGFLDKV